MTRARKTTLAAVLIAGVAVAMLAARVASYEPAADAPNGDVAQGSPWRGAFHVHSSASDDATGEIADIIAAARQAQVDFVVLSDHNPRAGDRPPAAWHDDVLLIVAEEISTEAGHLLALQVPPHRYRYGPTARQAIADIDAEGGWSMVAHAPHRSQRWRDGWGGTAGLEVVNLAAAWSRLGGWSRARTVAASLIDPDRAALDLVPSPWPMLATWDELTALGVDDDAVRRRRVAVGGADAHGPLVASIPSYADTLGTLATLVWVDESPEDARASGDTAGTEARLMAALRDGRAAIETSALGDARAFRFTAESPAGSARMGQFATFEDGPWTLAVDFNPADDAEIVLLRDGQRIGRADASSLRVVVEEPGTYRVETYRRAVVERWPDSPPWLVSNPIYVWPAAARSAARVRRTPPLPAPPMTTELLRYADFEANERGVARNRVVAGPPPRWSFALEDASAFDAFAAMVWELPGAGDWSRASGLVVHARSAQPLRINLEIRAAGADGETDSWVYSIKATPDGQPEAIPWHRFREPWGEDLSAQRNANPRRPTAAGLGAIEGVFLVVTPLLLEEGSAAEVELRVLGLYGER